MKISKYRQKHIFCIEGNWGNSHKDNQSIKTALEFLEANAGVNFIQKSCSTSEEFNALLKDAVKRTYKKFGIIYLAFHGEPGKLIVGKRKKIDFDSIAETLNGEAKDKIIHLGSCSTLDISGWDIRRFRLKTGALAISGYTTDVDFIESTVLDILYFRKCQEFQKVSLINNAMKLYYGKLVNDLGFKMNFEI